MSSRFEKPVKLLEVCFNFVYFDHNSKKKSNNIGGRVPTVFRCIRVMYLDFTFSDIHIILDISIRDGTRVLNSEISCIFKCRIVHTVRTVST